MQRAGREGVNEERQEAEQDAQEHDLRRTDRQDRPLHENEVGAPDEPEGSEGGVGQTDAGSALIRRLRRDAGVGHRFRPRA